MANSGEWTNIGDDIRGFVAVPASASPWPALILIHAIVGIDPHIERLAESFAGEGYYVAVPDIYANDPGFQQHSHETIEIAAHMGADAAKQKQKLAQYSAEQQAAILKARDWIDARPGHTYIDTVRRTYDRLQARRDLRALGAIGFCMGGRLVGELAATGAALAAGVIHYGSPPKLDLVPKIVAPLEGHYAATDTPITSKIPAFAAAMTAARKEFTHYIYEADHGFSLGNSGFPDAARLAMTRSRAFLAARLRPAALAGAAE
ncbi:MAG TPA: dienelactone hydrolase family protein [Stellaceae bacterium]|jgi:carboxymethylenebutenolidase|nr:dienelactone hydrolase family protein [Stellaceae bacterium]